MISPQNLYRFPMIIFIYICMQQIWLKVLCCSVLMSIYNFCQKSCICGVVLYIVKYVFAGTFHRRFHRKVNRGPE